MESKTKLYFTKIECPKKIYIRSSKLRMECEFEPAMSNDPISIQDAIILAQTPMIDKVMMFFEEGQAYYHDPVQKKTIYVTGWVDADFFEAAEECR